MNKSETIHVRVSPDIKNEAESIVNEMGLNLSYAITIYLKQIIRLKKIPFEIRTDDNETENRIEKLTYALNATGGKEIDHQSKKIIHLYASDQIDYETAMFALQRRFDS